MNMWGCARNTQTADGVPQEVADFCHRRSDDRGRRINPGFDPVVDGWMSPERIHAEAEATIARPMPSA